MRATRGRRGMRLFWDKRHDERRYEMSSEAKDTVNDDKKCVSRKKRHNERLFFLCDVAKRVAINDDFLKCDVAKNVMNDDKKTD